MEQLMFKLLTALLTVMLFITNVSAMHSPLAQRVLRKSAEAAQNTPPKAVATTANIANPDWQKKIIACMQDCIRVYYFWHRYDRSHTSYVLIQELRNFVNQDHKQPLFPDGPLLSSHELKQLSDRAKKYSNSKPYISLNEPKESVAQKYHEQFRSSCSQIKEVFTLFAQHLSRRISYNGDVSLQPQLNTAHKILELIISF